MGILGRLWLREHVTGIVADLRRVRNVVATVVPEFERVLSWFTDFGAFEREFPPIRAGLAANPGPEAGVGAGETAQGGACEGEGEDPLEERKKTLSKHAGMLCELLFCAFSGDTDQLLKNSMVNNEGAVSLASLYALREDGGGALGQHLREFVTAAESHKRVITVDTAGSAPPPGQKTLKRYASDESEHGGEAAKELAAERQELWKNAQALRKKSSQIVQWPHSTPNGPAVEKVYQRGGGAVKDFKGKKGENHRAFFFSVDAAGETAKEPWKEQSPAADLTETLEGAIQFFDLVKKPFDVLILCDGRDRQARRKLEDAIESMPHVCEFWVVYAGNGKVSGAGRNVSFAASNRETIYVALPVARTSVAKEDREQFNACGETSTHYTSYSGVPPLTLS